MDIPRIGSSFIYLFFAFLIIHEASAQEYIAGQTYFGSNDYIEYKAGNLPIVLSAAHGGSLTPSTIPDRNCTGCVYGQDLDTEDLSRKMYDAIFDLFGCYPHLIINRLHRRKLDANRAIGEAADGNPIAEMAWEEFQGFIELAKDTIESNYSKGLYFDIHGHGHEIQRLELGYRISKSELQLSDEELDMPTYVNKSSIENLVAVNLHGLEHSELLRGVNSLGQLYENENYPSVPSQNDPYPDSGDPYFRGGYNTQRHGSSVSGSIDAIQIECNRQGVRDSESNRSDFATSTALILKEYLEAHYFLTNSSMSTCGLVTATKNQLGLNDDLINIFPNPVSNQLKVFIGTATHDHTTISILNDLGRIVYSDEQLTSTDFELNVSNLSDGIYYVKVKTEAFVMVEKFIKY